MPSFRILIHSWEQKKVARSEVRQVKEGWDTTTILFLAKREAFADIAVVQPGLLVAPDGISVEDFKQCFQQWEQCWYHCIPSQMEYFEGD